MQINNHTFFIRHKSIFSISLFLKNQKGELFFEESLGEIISILFSRLYYKQLWGLNICVLIKC